MAAAKEPCKFKDLKTLAKKVVVLNKKSNVVSTKSKNKKQIVLCISESADISFPNKISTRLCSGILVEMKLPDEKIKAGVINNIARKYKA